MAITLQSAIAKLTKAKRDVEFYTDLVRVLGDPRAMDDELTEEAKPPQPAALVTTTPAAAAAKPMQPLKRTPHGEVKRKVEGVLPARGTAPITTVGIEEALKKSGYVFLSTNPIMAINDALGALKAEGKAKIAYRHGVTNYWTKDAPQPLVQQASLPGTAGEQATPGSSAESANG